MSRVSKSSKICSPNKNIFVYTYSYICQYDMAMLFAFKLKLYNIFRPLIGMSYDYRMTKTYRENTPVPEIATVPTACSKALLHKHKHHGTVPFLFTFLSSEVKYDVFTSTCVAIVLPSRDQCCIIGRYV